MTTKFSIYFLFVSLILPHIGYATVSYFVKPMDKGHRIGFECQVGVKGSCVFIGTPIITVDDFPPECEVCKCRADKIVICEEKIFAFCDEHAQHDPKDKNLIRFDSHEKIKKQQEKEELKKYKESITSKKK